MHSGLGRHIEYLQPEQIKNVLLLTTIAEVLHTVGTCLVRISVCLFVLRLVPSTHREFYTYTYVLIAFFVVITVATFMLILLGCVPIQGTWDREVKARCISRSAISVIARTQGGMFNPFLFPLLFDSFFHLKPKHTNKLIRAPPAICVLMDFLCVVLPIFFLRNLQAEIGRKISLFSLLALGLL